jgi:MFS transporter, MHS family, proline/betaine transporter
MSTIPLRQFSTKNLFAGIFGNILEHYDMALYAMLVPFLAPLFFPELPYLTGLIISYLIQVVGIVMKPLGAIIFGLIGDRFGRKRALSMTIIGLAACTALTGFLPTFEQIGPSAPVLLTILRSLQSLFAGGESNGGAIFVLEHGRFSWRGFLSSLYGSSTILGIFFASGAVALLAYFHLVEDYWRVLYWLGGLCGMLCISFRQLSDETQDYLHDRTPLQPFFKTFWMNRRAILAIVLAAGFSYVTYAIPFILMNSFLPLISKITKTEAMQINTSLLLFDMLLLPLFGLLTRRVSIEKIMSFAALFLAIFAIPLFLLLDNASIAMAIFVRLTIVTAGVAFAAPFSHWTICLVSVKSRCLVTSFATTLGSQLIGAPCAAICIWLFQKTGWVVGPAFYLTAAAVGALIALRLQRVPFTETVEKNRKKVPSFPL